MKAQKRAKAEGIFRNKEAIKHYNYLSNNSNVYEYGVDGNGNIYFAYLNGNVDRFTRQEFLKESKFTPSDSDFK